MTKFESIIEDFGNAVARLDEVLKLEKNEVVRDSSIKRFEMVFDLAWKSIKACLEEKHNVTCTSPMSCFREAYHQGLIEYDNFWLEIAKSRNYTVHAYDEKLAEKIYSILPRALEYFKKLLGAIKNN